MSKNNKNSTNLEDIKVWEDFKNQKFLDGDKGEISKKSLKAVKLNSLKFKIYERTKLINLDWSSPDWDRDLLDFEKNIKFDAIVTNPPYIPSAEIKLLQKEVKYYDPLIALDGGKDGLDAYRLIFSKLFKLLKPNGKIFIFTLDTNKNELPTFNLMKIKLLQSLKKDKKILELIKKLYPYRVKKKFIYKNVNFV